MQKLHLILSTFAVLSLVQVRAASSQEYLAATEIDGPQQGPPLSDTAPAFIATHFDNAASDSDTVSTDAKIAQLQCQLNRLRSEFCGSQTRRACESRSCGNGAGLDAGFSLVFAKPHMKESFESTVIDVVGGSLNMVPFDFDHDISPRIWLEYFGAGGMGARVRYWQYDHNANPLSEAATFTTFPGVSSISVIYPAAISTAAPGDILSVESGLQVHTLDLEGAIRDSLFGVHVLASAGFRYASMEQHFQSDVMRGPITIGSLDWTREFEGGGLTTGIDARKQLGSSSLSLLGTARVSLLFGEKNLQRSVVGDVTPPSSTVPPVVVLDDADEVSGIFELSAGAEWARSIQCGELFVRGSYEAQLWTAAGAPTLTFLGFEGLGVSVGLRR